ncbi:aromatic ring-hydroxylating oxygenase subunit alpha [Oceanicoccus sagamiensis]|uniref:(2Fe-2S)-binding protein n=1 Tax=Oceanicoccus sagamiensis TaxID=716816 RepID=A0A1X9NCF7_9GAMM|nr:aromatic ring-hydroxylating dioxygenase subunit alpha [Oceanicoccus sagamiensis]ARN75710.1 (2Fe-2S)-binding protein [Oceanicoccus sagamiensis]
MSNDARSDSISYQQLLDQEKNPVPEALRVSTETYLGSEPLSTDRYLSRDYYELEKTQLWPKVWQSVCRETEIADAGDFYTLDIASYSVVVVRTEDGEIKAYLNSCLHRGRQLKSGSGNSRDLKCPFHGFRWDLDGDFIGAPCAWDFPHIDDKHFSLAPVKVDTWGGWVFINRDNDAVSLKDYMGVMGEHFQRWQPEKTYKAMHLKKVLRCNWKLAHEAFIESFHTVATHPQLLPYTADANSQYDCFNDHVSRTITPMGVVSPNLLNTTEQQSVNQWLTIYGVATEDNLPTIPEGMKAREYLGQLNIERFSEMYQQDLSAFVTHSEVLDAILYSVFPNFAPWAGYRPNVTYRFLPYEDSHELCTMEIMLLMRFPNGEQRPKDVAITFVGPDQTFAETEGIDAGLAKVFDQDFSNLPMVQKGLKSLAGGEIQLANYQEVRIRHFHQTLDKYINA